MSAFSNCAEFLLASISLIWAFNITIEPSLHHWASASAPQGWSLNNNAVVIGLKSTQVTPLRYISQISPIQIQIQIYQIQIQIRVLIFYQIQIQIPHQIFYQIDTDTDTTWDFLSDTDTDTPYLFATKCCLLCSIFY